MRWRIYYVTSMGLVEVLRARQTADTPREAMCNALQNNPWLLETQITAVVSEEAVRSLSFIFLGEEHLTARIDKDTSELVVMAG